MTAKPTTGRGPGGPCSAGRATAAWRTLRRLLAAAATLLLFACRSAAPGARAGSSPPQWSATEDLRIGSVDDSATMLTGVSSLAVGPDGSVAVAQPLDGDVRVFDSAGRPLRTIGRRGRGPGEFENAYSVQWLGDTLVTVDPALIRETLFSAAGRVLGSFSATPKGLSEEYSARFPFWLARDGTLLEKAEPRMLGSALPILYLRIERAGTIVDTLLPDSTPHRYAFFKEGLSGQPFLDDPVTAPSVDGALFAVVRRKVAETAETDSFRVTVLRSSRDTVYSRAYRYTPIPLPGRLVDSLVAIQARAMLHLFGGDSALAVRTIHDAILIPKYTPPISQALFADDGDLWLRREDLPGARQRWMVLDSVGDPVGRVALPQDLLVKLVHGSALWGVAFDSLGVPYVVRDRIGR